MRASYSSANLTKSILVYKYTFIYKECFFMTTTVRINEDVKQQLKIHSAKVGIKQIDLLNKYVIEGIKKDRASEKQTMSLEEVEKLLIHDKPTGNNLDKIDGLIKFDKPTNSVQLKRNNYYGF